LVDNPALALASRDGYTQNSAYVALLRYRALASGQHRIDIGDGYVLGEMSKWGKYRLTVSVAEGDRDFFAVNLKEGDVIGVSGINNLPERNTATGLYGTDGKPVQTVVKEWYDYDPASSLYPVSSPLPGSRGPVAQHVAPRDGRYYVEIRSSARDFSPAILNYRSQIEVYRSGGTGDRSTQTIYLDFDGATIDTSIWDSFTGKNRQLSPLKKFMKAWKISPTKEPELVELIKASVTENLQTDLEESGLSDTVDVDILTNRDGPDPFGNPGGSRVIVGGTMKESGLQTIGIAESIDPGNFAREESALVLLDSLSGPTGSADSLNDYLKPSSDRLMFVAQGLGNVISHEVGHLIGNFHTTAFNTTRGLMDEGGTETAYASLYGVGPDKTGGTTDDTDTDFTTDNYSRYEEVSSTFTREDTLTRSTLWLSRKP
jgi:hypothetical protein